MKILLADVLENIGFAVLGDIAEQALKAIKSKAKLTNINKVFESKLGENQNLK